MSKWDGDLPGSRSAGTNTVQAGRDRRVAERWTGTRNHMYAVVSTCGRRSRRERYWIRATRSFREWHAQERPRPSLSGSGQVQVVSKDRKDWLKLLSAGQFERVKRQSCPHVVRMKASGLDELRVDTAQDHEDGSTCLLFQLRPTLANDQHQPFTFQRVADSRYVKA